MEQKLKTKKVKPKVELIIIESPKNITLKSTSKKCKKGTQKYKPLGFGCYTKEEIDNFKLTKKVKKVKKAKKGKKGENRKKIDRI